MSDIMTITRGDLEPDIVISISDARSDANFASLTADKVRITGELNGDVVLDVPAEEITIAGDSKSAVVRRSWGVGETDVAGRMYVRARVDWTVLRGQSFPRSGPLIIDIRRKPGDA